jgi:ABC-type amino acid transport substrate-binding protein
MWPNSARAREAVFSIAPMNSVLYPYVRSGDSRFDGNLTKINSNQITVSAVDGELATFIAKDDYPLAKLNTLPQLTSYAEVFLNIVNGKADITFAEPSAVNDFLKSNPGKIQRVGNTPVRTFGNSFAFVRGQESMISMWNVALGELINDGTVTRTLEKYNVAGDYSLNK